LVWFGCENTPLLPFFGVHICCEGTYIGVIELSLSNPLFSLLSTVQVWVNINACVTWCKYMCFLPQRCHHAYLPRDLQTVFCVQMTPRTPSQGCQLKLQQTKFKHGEIPRPKHGAQTGCLRHFPQSPIASAESVDV
jgi:hypothetical protein